MTQDWIADLATNIKQKNQDAANEYGRAQHRAGVIADRGPAFFAAVVTCLQQNVDELRRELQGDITSADLAIDSIDARQIKLTRSRFPWVDATLTLQEADLVLAYAKGAGVPADAAVAPSPITHTFILTTSPNDTLYAEDAFNPIQYRQPEDLARRITEMLFSV